MEKKKNKGTSKFINKFISKKAILGDIFIVIFLLAVAFDLADNEYTIMKSCCFKSNLKKISRGRFLCIDDVMDAFTEVWGIAVAIMIFLLEFAQNVKYGITLKRIAVLEVGKKAIKRLAVIYLMLYPAAYAAHYYGLTNILFLIWLLMIVGLFGTLWFCTYKTRAESIRNTLKKHTINTLREINGCKSGQSMENMIDGLSITDVLLHTDYMNKEERDVISDIIVDILTDEKLFFDDQCKAEEKSLLKNVILMNWIERISSKFELEDKRQKEILIRFLNNLLDKMDDWSSKKKKWYGMQCMIALLKYNSSSANSILLQIWKRIDEKECILVYLLLYTEFYYWSGNHELLEWVFLPDSELKKSFQDILMGNVNYDYNQAIEYWISWMDYDGKKIETGFNYFNSFISTLDCFRGKIASVKQEPCITLDYLK